MPVIGDDLRQFHPDYARLMREEPLSMPAATAQASGQWIGMAADYLRAQRSDVLIETTLRSPEAMAQTISAFRQAGYVVELRVVAVPQEVSRLSTVERYTRQVEDTGAGRWTPAAAHDEAYAKAAGTVEELIASGRVDRLVIEDRGGSVLLDRSYFGLRDRELSTVGRQAAGAVERVHALSGSTPDLLDTIRTVATVDSREVAVRAWPHDGVRARAAADALADMVPRTVHHVRSLLSVSFPQSARAAVASTPGREADTRAYCGLPPLRGRGKGNELDR